MIHLFEKGKRILFFPRRWANSVTKWLMGVHSPTGTIRITNTANPSNEKSVALDVDLSMLSRRITEKLEKSNLSQEQRQKIREVIRDCLDGTSVFWGDNAVSVSVDWVEDVIRCYLITEGAPCSLKDAIEAAEKEDSYGVLRQDGTFEFFPIADPGLVTEELTSGADTPAVGADDSFRVENLDKEKGVKFKVLSRAESLDDGVNCVLYFRELTISSDGRIVAIGGESECIQVYESQE